MSPTPTVGVVIGALALGAILLPVEVVVLLGIAALSVAAVDALSVRKAPTITRTLARTLARGVETPLVIEVSGERGRVRLRQAATPDLAVTPGEADGALRASLLPLRRGRHLLPGAAARTTGVLGLGCWYHPRTEDAEVLVYPDLPAARRLALAVRHGRFKDPGVRHRGPLGLGTDFESIREYLPDDDIRQVNWRATARLGRPMSNQYRIEQDRDVICVIDTGRLMTSPLGPDRTRLDIALDAVAALALVADEVGDRCGALAFDSEMRRRVRTQRAGGDAVIKGVFDLEPRAVDSDYELAFRMVGGGKRALVFVFTDLLEESAARPLIEAVPVLARRHAVVVASASDPDLDALLKAPPRTARDVYAAAAAVEVLEARARAGLRIGRAGADVVEAPPRGLGAACVSAYLQAKSRARL